MHAAARRWCDLLGHDRAGWALDLGGRDVNGSVRSYWPAMTWVGVDLHDGPGVDIPADCRDYTPLPRYELVLCTEVFEHVPGWGNIVSTAWRALVPGGLFVATTAGPQRRPHHYNGGGPPHPGEWYRNVDPEQLRIVLDVCGFVPYGDGHVDSTGFDVRCAVLKPFDVGT